MSEYILGELGARTVFATLYHELTQLAAKYTGARNLNVAVREWQDELIFLHKIVEGGADRSYGIHVAKLAGIPAGVVQRGKEILAKLEADSPVLASGTGHQARAAETDKTAPTLKRPKVQLSLFTVGENAVIKALRAIDTSRLTPEQALAELLKLRDLARE
jgi:DNA mismatch repair protein MutS